jgi:glutamyl-tRNA synthetase
VFDDLVRGPIEVDPRRHGGDFVIWRAAAVPAYQLAVAVDDAFQGVTQVVRGDDLLSSTPRQMLILQALGMPVPQYAHVPLVVGADGRRLAKRHGDTRLVTLRERGIKPEKLIGLLAHSCGWIDESKPITARELINHFRWDSLPKTPFVFSEELLQ